MIPKAVIAMLVFGLSISHALVQSCELSLDSCEQNITMAFYEFMDYFVEANGRYAKLDQANQDEMDHLIYELNIDIEAGIEECQSRLLTKPNGYYLSKALDECFTEGPAYPKMPTCLPEDFLQNNSAESRVEYCAKFVPYLSRYCAMLEKRLVDYDQCDTEANFNKLFRNKWRDCVLRYQ